MKSLEKEVVTVHRTVRILLAGTLLLVSGLTLVAEPLAFAKKGKTHPNHKHHKGKHHAEETSGK